MEVCRWNPNEVGECAVCIEDTHHLSVRAVALESLGTGRTALAGEVDLTDHALPAQLFGALFHDPHELVPERAAKAHVATHDLEVRLADTGQAHADDDSLITRPRLRDVLELDAATVKSEGVHVT